MPVQVAQNPQPVTSPVLRGNIVNNQPQIIQAAPQQVFQAVPQQVIQTQQMVPNQVVMSPKG